MLTKKQQHVRFVRKHKLHEKEIENENTSGQYLCDIRTVEVKLEMVSLDSDKGKVH